LRPKDESGKVLATTGVGFSFWRSLERMTARTAAKPPPEKSANVTVRGGGGRGGGKGDGAGKPGRAGMRLRGSFSNKKDDDDDSGRGG
jgi:hypothetical protein